jgi:hypothetical protein
MIEPDSRSIARQSGLKGRPTLNLQIEKVVLRGFASINSERVGESARGELARLFEQRGIPRFLAAHTTIDLLNGGSFKIASTSGAEQIGTQLAQAIYQALTRGSGEQITERDSQAT